MRFCRNSCGSRTSCCHSSSCRSHRKYCSSRFGADPSFLVLPVRGDAFLGDPVHLGGADLHLERKPPLAHHRGVQRLVAVRPRHRDEVLDAARHRRPRLMDDPERRVAVAHRAGHDPQRHEIVDLLEIDLLPPQLLMDAEQPLDPPVDVDHRHLGLVQLGGDVLPQLLDHPFRDPPPRFDPLPQRLVGLRLEVLERQLLELVLHLAHPEPVGNRRVDVARLLRDLDPALLGQMVQRPHVVQPIRQLHQDHPDVVHHRQQHLAEVLRLPLFARRELNRSELGHPLDHVRDVGAEQLADPLDRGLGVLDDVVQQARGDRHHVELHVGQQVGDLERMHQVRLSRMAHLALVLEGGKDVRPPQQFGVGVRIAGPDFFDEVLEPDHGNRCLTVDGVSDGKRDRHVVTVPSY